MTSIRLQDRTTQGAGPKESGGSRIAARLRTSAPLAAVLAVAALARVPYLTTRSVWYDEASSWQTARFALPELFRSLRLNVHMPLYYLLLKGWMGVFGDSVVALRLLSVALGLVTVAAAYFLACEVYQASAALPPSASRARRFALAASALVAFSAFQVNASIEARMYALGTALAMSGSCVLLRIVRGVGKAPSWWAYAAISLAFLYTHHYALFLLAAQGTFVASYAVVLARRGERARAANLLGNGLLVALVVAAGYFPGLSILSGQVRRVRQDYWTQPLSARMVLGTFREFVVALKPVEANPANKLGAIAASALFGLACVRLAYRGGAGEAFLLALGLLPMAFAALVTLWTPVWEGRFFRFNQPFLLLALALAAWRSAGRSDPARVALLGLILSGAVASLLWFWQVRDISHRTGMRGALAKIVRDDRRGDLIVADSHLHYFAAKYYAPAGVRVRLEEAAATRDFWASHLIRPGDLISADQLAKELRWGAWLVRINDDAAAYAEDVGVFPAETARFDYDRGVPDWTIFVTHVERSPESRDLARAAAAVRARRSDSVLFAGARRLCDPDLEPLRGLAGLARLNLAGTGITDRGLASLGDLTDLRELSLSGTRIGGKGLASLRRMRRLRALWLDRLTLGDDALRSLAELPGLKELSLWKSKFSDAGLARLAASPTLERLSLDETNVTDRGLRALGSSRSLKYLSLWRTGVGQGALQDLRLRRPGLAINR